MKRGRCSATSSALSKAIGYPQRPVARDAAAEKALKARTLTNLYNTRPQWLVDAHAALDGAVAAAYGWDVDISIDDALRTLLVLNLWELYRRVDCDLMDRDLIYLKFQVIRG